MHIIEDTRQKAGQHEHKNRYFEACNVSVTRSKLPFGDYMVVPLVAVDTKQNILELCTDIDQQHDRFRRECIKARDAGCKLFVLVENLDGVEALRDLRNWVNPRAEYNARKGLKAPITGSRLMKACLTMEAKYGVCFQFCTPDEAGRRILELLNERI